MALHLPSANPVKPIVQTQPLDWAGVRAVRPWGITRGWAAVLLFLPGPLFLLATFVFRGPNRGLLVLLALGVFLVSAGEAPPEGFDAAARAQGTDAADQWLALTRAHPDEPGLWYNEALASRDAGRTAQAVHGFRMALRTGFQGDQAARALVNLEEKELLTDQFVPWTGWPTNFLFL